MRYLREYSVTPQPDLVRFGELGWKDRYYEVKFGISLSDDTTRQAVGLAYIRGLCWVLRYYYQGVPSWTWYYPYHYAPCASDLVGISEIEQARKFELGEPFNPLEQLVAVLPPLSAPALPGPLAQLFETDDPQLAQFFPREVKFDLNGAREAYKAVVLLPFIDAPTLRNACAERLPLVTSEERARNRFGPTYLYVPAQDRLAREVRWTASGGIAPRTPRPHHSMHALLASRTRPDHSAIPPCSPRPRRASPPILTGPTASLPPATPGVAAGRRA